MRPTVPLIEIAIVVAGPVVAAAVIPAAAVPARSPPEAAKEREEDEHPEQPEEREEAESHPPVPVPRIDVHGRAGASACRRRGDDRPALRGALNHAEIVGKDADTRGECE